MDVMTPTNFRNNIFKEIEDITKHNKMIELTVKNKPYNDGVVMMNKKEYNSIMETLHLLETGVLREVYERAENSTEDDFEIV